MIHVDEGGEYRGETYIWCDLCSGGGYPVRNDHPDCMFEGDSIEELKAFLVKHDHDPAVSRPG